ncbi:hypothetical protein GQ600_16334 [Phytophthora cactorum]|nr:hypothetical protein GQ600_16334 [Phytophthora cactorum]
MAKRRFLMLDIRGADKCRWGCVPFFAECAFMQQWLHEVRCWDPGGPFGIERDLWMDNASGHSSEAVQALGKALRARIRFFFSPNASEFIQAADRFPIQRIKVHWRALCEKRNMDAIRRGDCMQGPKSSGALDNPGNKFYLETAAEYIRQVNAKTDKNNMN